MKLFFLDWDSYGKEDLIASFEALGHEVVRVSLKMGDYMHDPEFARAFREALSLNSCDAVFSSNYYPVVSGVCQSRKVPYISWIYDSPLITLYSRTAKNPCNSIFVFDRVLYEDLISRGLQTVHYMPLGVNVRRLGKIVISGKDREKYSADVAFVGSLYDNKNNLYDRMVQKGLSERTRGYLEGIMNAQLQVQGIFFLEDLLTDEVLADMKRAMEYLPPRGVEVTEKYVYANYFLGHKVTAIERRRLLTLLSERFSTRIYTTCDTTAIPGLKNRGPVDYVTEMPKVFRLSKINLNMTLRTIQSGIPLRGMDIMGAGGFLLSSYQADFFPDFVPGEHFDYYADETELLEKTEYYLSHEKERQQIAENAAQKIKESYRMEQLLNIMLETAGI